MAAAASTDPEGASGVGNVDIEGWHDVDKEHYERFKRHRAAFEMELPAEANLKVKAGVKKQRRENRQRRNGASNAQNAQPGIRIQRLNGVRTARLTLSWARCWPRLTPALGQVLEQAGLTPDFGSQQVRVRRI